MSADLSLLDPYSNGRTAWQTLSYQKFEGIFLKTLFCDEKSKTCLRRASGGQERNGIDWLSKCGNEGSSLERNQMVDALFGEHRKEAYVALIELLYLSGFCSSANMNAQDMSLQPSGETVSCVASMKPG